VTDSETNGRCLGLIGGLGVGATIHYYQALARAHEQRGRLLDMVIAHAEVPRVFAYVEAGDRAGLAGYLNGFIRRLQAAGAEVAAIPAITPHYCIGELVAISPLPVVDIFEPLKRELSARAAKRVAVFGTRYVMESELFGLAGGVQIIKTTPEETDLVHKIYVELTRVRKGTDEQHRKLTALAQTLCRRDGAEAILFAGTDLSLVFNEGNTDFPHIDCAALHVQAIVDGMLGETAA
jgi:aspartate racemase